MPLSHSPWFAYQGNPVEIKSTSVAEQPLTLTLVLKRDDRAGVERYLRDVCDSISISILYLIISLSLFR